MSYYKELARAKRHAINFVNEELYPDNNIPRPIFLREIRLEIAPDFSCNYEKVFLDIIAEFMKGDKRIVYDSKKETWSIK